MAHLPGHSRRGSKQHAQRRDVAFRSAALWVYDEVDWELMRSLPSGALICPEPGCRSPFQVPQENAHGTRFLKNMPEVADCGHAMSRPDLGGGAMSRQHRWYQARLASICRDLKHEAVLEDYSTRADVLVRNRDPRRRDLCLEVQRWTTAFHERTLTRAEQGLDVLWLITADASGTGTTEALFTMPAARVRVYRQGDRSRPIAPWDDPSLNSVARLEIGATTARWSDERGHFVSAGHVDAYQFLREVLDGDRVWSRRLSGLSYSAWVLRRELLEAARHADRQAAAADLALNLVLARQQTPATPATEPLPGADDDAGVCAASAAEDGPQADGAETTVPLPDPPAIASPTAITVPTPLGSGLRPTETSTSTSTEQCPARTRWWRLWNPRRSRPVPPQ